MPFHSLPNISDGSYVFIDANIFVYGLNGASVQCEQLLQRCSREEVSGICLYEIVSEATHRFMVQEAFSKSIITRNTAAHLRNRYDLIPGLIDYWTKTEMLLDLNLLFLTTDESIIRMAQSERQNYGLLTNDSMIVSCMRRYGVTSLATSDRDFERVSDIVVFRPDDLP
ncbi:MAG TPA: type II toxin-antitoxin system VapC family toxin [Blastocatellia bacterium]